MNLTIPQSTLNSLIVRGGAVAQKKAIIPALEHIRIVADADANTLSLASSDMDRFAEATAHANVEEGGSLLVPAQAFATLIGKHPKSAEISLELDGASLIVKAGRSTVTLPTIDAGTFPGWADEVPHAQFDLPGEDFERAFSRVRFAASDSDAQFYLQGVCIDAIAEEQVLHFVATDTHRLALSGVPLPAGAGECPRIIVPSESVDAALKVFKGTATVHMTATNRAIGFSADGLRLSARLIEGTFPDYQRIMPTQGESPSVTFKRADFVDCLDRANVLTGEGTYAAITLEPTGPDGLRLEARNQRGGAADEELAGVCADGFEPFRFNPRYAAAFISTLTVGDLTIEQADPKGPHLISSPDAPDFLGILMPVAK